MKCGSSVLLLVVLLSGASASVGAAQQRDRPVPIVAPIKKGTAIVSGRVTLTEDSQTPVRRAVVSLDSGDSSDRRSVVTDQDGRFTFRALSAGRYSLFAEKPAHLKSSYGARRPGRPGTALIVAEGQQLTDVRLPLPRGAVLAGTLTTALGEPLANTQVVAIPIAEATAGGRSTNSTEFSTDDRGAFRIFGLAAGEYLVAALPVVGSGAVEMRTEAEFDAITRELTRRTAPGAAANPPAATTPPSLRGFAPTYYPGTPVAAQALPIKVAMGEVREGLDIPITMFRMSTISGTVFGVDGVPAQGVHLSTDAVGPTLPLAGTPIIRSAPPDAQGRFTVLSVPPGSYRITVRGGGNDGTMPSLNTEKQTDWASADVQVVGEDISGLTLSLQPGMKFSGTLTTAGSGPAVESWQTARVTVQPIGAGANAGQTSRAVIPTASGAFEVAGIQPGRYEIAVHPPSNLRSGWAIRSIVVDGRDIRDAPLTFENGSLSNVAITLTDQPSIVTGTLSSTAGTPAADYYVVVFPADRALWHAASSRVKVVRPGVDGVFSIRELPAGEYRLAALTDVEDNEWRSGTFLDSLLATSITVTVKEGATTRQDVRIR